MEVGLVTKLDKRNKTTSKKRFTMTSFPKIATLFSFFQFLGNLEQFGSRVPDAESAKFNFSINSYPSSYKN